MLIYANDWKNYGVDLRFYAWVKKNDLTRRFKGAVLKLLLIANDTLLSLHQPGMYIEKPYVALFEVSQRLLAVCQTHFLFFDTHRWPRFSDTFRIRCKHVTEFLSIA